ncbi:MAG: class B sortase [Erysipelothrix sp.]|nr:class B sortase [Erysipelothrix sp.]
MNNEEKESQQASESKLVTKPKKKLSLNTIIRSFGILLIMVAVGLYGYEYYLTYINQQDLNKVVELMDVRDEIRDRLIEENPDLDFEEIERLSLAELHQQFASINSDYVGWIVVNGTKINYPFVLGNDNTYYLNRNFQKRSLKHGAIFMDYRNQADFSDRHIVLYGHAMRDQSMFGSIDLYKNRSFYNNHSLIEIRLKDEIRTYKIFSAYQVDATITRLNIPANNRSLSNLFDLFTSRAIYDTNTDLTNKDHILTLVSCTDDVENGRIIVHAVLQSISTNP